MLAEHGSSGSVVSTLGQGLEDDDVDWAPCRAAGTHLNSLQPERMMVFVLDLQQTGAPELALCRRR
jgi:hypothetical protein